MSSKHTIRQTLEDALMDVSSDLTRLQSRITEMETERRLLETLLSTDFEQMKIQYKSASQREVIDDLAVKNDGVVNAKTLSLMFVLMDWFPNLRQAQTSISPTLSRYYDKIGRGLWRRKERLI